MELPDDTQKYLDIAKVIISRLIDKPKDQVTYFDVITIAMAVAERFRDDNGFKLTGPQKKQLAKSILPLIVDLLVEMEVIDIKTAKKFKWKLEKKAQQLDDFIEIAVKISNDPDLINLGKWVYRRTHQAFKSCCQLC